MDIGPATVAHLATITAITGMVGDRIYPQYVREADRTYPYIVYQTQVETIDTFDGECAVERGRIDLAAVGATQAQARQLGRAIQTALDGHFAETWGTVEVQGVFLADDGIKDDVVTDPETEAILCYVKQVSFDVVYVPGV